MKLITSLYHNIWPNTYFIIAPYPESNVVLQIAHVNFKRNPQEIQDMTVKTISFDVARMDDFIPMRKPNETTNYILPFRSM